MRNYIREPINSLTHLIGAILSLLALIAMITKVCVSGKTYDFTVCYLCNLPYGNFI